jgi:adenine-specific DNA-methyltransferase
VSRPDLVEALREAGDADFDVLIACAFNYDGHATDLNKFGRIPLLKARMNANLRMADDLKNTGKGSDRRGSAFECDHAQKSRLGDA